MSLSAHSTNTAGRELRQCHLTWQYPLTQLGCNTQHLRLCPPHLASSAGARASTAWLRRHILKSKPVSAFSTGAPIHQVLPSKAVTHLQLVEPRGEPLRTPRNRNVVLLPARYPVLFTGGPASYPLLWLYVSEQGGRRARLRCRHGRTSADRRGIDDRRWCVVDICRYHGCRTLVSHAKEINPHAILFLIWWDRKHVFQNNGRPQMTDRRPRPEMTAVRVSGHRLGRQSLVLYPWRVPQVRCT